MEGGRQAGSDVEASLEPIENRRVQACGFSGAEVPWLLLFCTGTSDVCQIHPWQVFRVGGSQSESLCGAAVLEKLFSGSRDDSGIQLP